MDRSTNVKIRLRDYNRRSMVAQIQERAGEGKGNNSVFGRAAIFVLF